MNAPTPERRPTGFDGLRRPEATPAQTPKLPSPEPTLEPLVSQPIAAEVLSAAQAPVFQYEKPQPKKWKRRTVIGGTVAVGLLAAVFGAKVLLATQKVITRNANGSAPALAGNIDPTKLKGEGDGRINILLMGIGGPGHEGPFLSDTMIVASIDPRTKNVAMLSLPRDLYVSIPGYGSSKINAAGAYGEDKKRPGGGGALAKQTVSKVLDIPVHYYIRVDFNAFKQAVDSVGGIDVNVEQALNDPEYPCDKNPGRSCGFKLAAGQKHMDGALSLKFARCRKGNCGDDFGRAMRQQQVMLGLREKALSLQTLSNPAKVLKLIDAIGAHVNTDLKTNEIRRLVDLAKQINTQQITSKVLDESTNLVTISNVSGAGSVVIPKAGVGNFADIRSYVHGIFVDSYLKEEAAAIEIQNGTNRSGLAATVAKLLQGYNYNVTKTATAANQNYPTTVIYDYTDGKKPYTVGYLESRFRVKAQRANPTAEDQQIKIILGGDYRTSSARAQ